MLPGKPNSHRFFLPFFSFSLFFFIASLVHGAEVQLAWTPNSEANLAGYNVHFGTASRDYTEVTDVGNPVAVDNQIIATLSNFSPGITYYFAATAYDVDSFESDYSDEAVWTCPQDPVPPPANNIPVAVNDAVSTSEDNPKNGFLTATDADNDTLTYSVVSNGSRGTVTMTNAATGAYTYTPAADTNGSDSFSFKVNDGTADSNIATVSINIAAVNDIAVAVNDAVSTSEDNPKSGFLTATDADNDTLTYSVVSNGSMGTVTMTNAATGAYTYTPAADTNGPDSFNFKVNDGTTDSNIATVSVDIEAVNDAPVAQAATFSMNQNEDANGILVGSDIDSSNLTYSISSNCSLGTLTMTNAATGAYRYTANVGAFGDDDFQFKVTDAAGAVSTPATVSISINQVESTFVMEMGTVTVNKDWLTVEFSEPFTDPIVVAKPASHQDENYCVVRLRNISATGFEIRLQNWDYLADDHGDETVSFVAVERGSFEMSDGTLVEAGSFETDKTGTLSQISFTEPCNVVPVVAASIITDNEADAVVGRIRNISATGFEYGMQEQEANAQSHTLESINYIAWEPSSGMNGNLVYEIGATGDEVTHAWKTISFSADFDAAPIMIADMQTIDGGDTANLRYNEMNASQMQIKIAEEQSSNTETDHTTEIVGFMAFAVIDLDGDPDQDGLTTGTELDTYGTQPGMIDTDMDGLNDGAEVDFWGADWNKDVDQDGVINLLDADSDNDGYADGVEVAMSFDPADGSSHPAGPGLEVGLLQVDTDWQRISFNNTFVNPVLVAKIVSQNGDDPCIVRLNNIDADGFDIRLQEWDYQDGVHSIESVSYIVMERGSYTLDDGTLVEAGHFSSNEMVSYDEINFNQAFNLTPVVTASIASFNEIDAVTGRMRDISTSGLRFKLQEQEANGKIHAVETVSYIAWEPSSGLVNGQKYEVSRTTDSVKHEYVDVNLTANFSEIPVVLADMQTTDGGDTSTARCDNSLVDSFSMRIEEEKSRDTEIAHTHEVVGYMAIAGL